MTNCLRRRNGKKDSGVADAGLRVLLIMHKACTGGLSLYGENDVVGEILEQTGFDSFFHR